MLYAVWVMSQGAALAGTDVLMSRNDRGRTGANLTETVLTTSNVNTRQFGWLFEYSVRGNIFAQPLVVTEVRTASGLRDLVYAATTDNLLYAFDANSNRNSGGLIWVRDFNEPPSSDPGHPVPIVIDDDLTISLRPPNVAAVGPIPWNDVTHYSPPIPSKNFPGGTTFEGNVGIVSTPIIDRARATIYLVVRTKQGSEYSQALHALDIGSGREKPGSPMRIGPPSPDPTSFAAVQNQRSGLAISGNRIVVAWGSPGGVEGTLNHGYYGYVLTYDADTLVRVGCFNFGVPDSWGPGIWQSGRAPVIDEDGYVYFFTGNFVRKDGNAPGPATLCDLQHSARLSNSLVKLDVGTGVTVSHFVPDPERMLLDVQDMDLSGSGPLLVPGTSILIGGGKRGFLYLYDQNESGLFARQWFPMYDHRCFDPTTTCVDPNDPECCYLDHGHNHVMGGPVYWENAAGPTVYVSIEDDVIKAYRLTKAARRIDPVPIMKTTDKINGHPGAILSLSASASTQKTGILWAANADRSMRSADDFRLLAHGILHAYDAENLKMELWNSKLHPEDDLGLFAKFTPPTIANGKVYMATFSGKLKVYGLLATPRSQ